ncbi:MAG TPA: type II secretion system secretin GspD [Gammaproteobacteria bacterium]
MRSVALAVAMAAAAFAPAAPAQDAPPAGSASEPTVMTLNFEDMEIRDVARAVGEVTGKSFILDPRVKGRVTIVSAQPIPIDAVYETFLSVLQVHNFAAVPAGENIIKIIPAVNAREIASADPVEAVAEAPADDVVTRIIEVRNVEAVQLVPLLRPLVPQTAHLAAYAGGNMLIISDRAANVERITKIIRRMDQTTDEEIEVVRLENASASEVVRVLSALVQNRAEAGRQPPVLVADDRTNSILVSGDKASRLRLRALIAHLDTPLESGGNTQVIYLRYADAESLATILSGHVTESAASANGGGEKTAAAVGGGYADVIILPEPDTNALVVTAPPKVMRTLENIIAKLDIRRAQVHVEAIIAELSADNSAELGVTWAVADESGEGPVGLTNFPTSGAGIGQVGAAAAAGGETAAQAIGNLLASASGLSLGFGRISDGDVSFVGLLRALAGSSSTNILSTPSLTTMDNEEAEITVGQEVPFLTGSFTNTGAAQGNINPFQTIQRKEVGLSLTITPQISDSNTIVLDIAQEVSSLSGSSQGAVDLVTDTRSITTSVIAESGEIIVLGGLIDERVTESEQRVPLLGSIPILGHLFRYETSSKDKRNLMVFIKPSILRTPEDSAYFTGEKYRYIRNLQEGERDGGVNLMPFERQPALPDPDAADAVTMPADADDGHSSSESRGEPQTDVPAEDNGD